MVKTVALFVFTQLSLFAQSSFAQQKVSDPAVLSIERDERDNTVHSVSFAPSAGFKAAQAQEVFKKYLGIDGVNNKLVEGHSTTTAAKLTTTRYAQYINDIKVEGSGYTVTVKDGLIRFITGNVFVPTTPLSTTTSITEGIAFSYALDRIGAEKYMWQDPKAEQHIKWMYHKPDTSYLPHGNLVWATDHTNPQDRTLHLAYSFDIYAQYPASRNVVFIDAQSGKVLFVNAVTKHTAATNRTKYSQVVSFQTANMGSEYILFDSTRGGGVYTVSANYDTVLTSAIDITSPTNFWPVLSADTQALDAHWGAEQVYDFFLTQLGRHSWDDADGMLLSFVHLNSATGGYNNAYWDGYEMVYGDGTGSATGFDPLTSLDVAAHEIGHGVCQATANLDYELESGAMNEGFSDCWAASIENWANPYEVDAVAKRTWKIGEEIDAGSPLRSMDYPELQGDPNTYGGTNWYPVASCTPTTTNDHCGVHTNSGVLNKWYYLLVNGGAGTNDIGNVYSVTGIGFTDGVQILYQTELVLSNTATYAQCRTASINAATTLFGACSAQTQAVTNAWYGVGVGTSFVPCVPQLGFNTTIMNVTENAATTSCPASRTVNIGIRPVGTPISGGSPVVNVFVGHGSAVSGVDYALGTTSITFPPSDTSTRYATITLYDNGTVRDDKYIMLGMTVAAMGSTAILSPTNDSVRINFRNNDSIPNTGLAEYHTLNTGTAGSSVTTSAFPGNNRRAHTQYLLTAAEMTAAGVRPGVPINQIAFNIVSKSSTAAFVNYSLRMGNTSAANLNTAYATGTVQVYSGSPTTNVGLDSLDFNVSTFTWDGTSNVAVEFCYGQNGAAAGASDVMQAIDNGTTIVTNRNITNGGSGTGCTLNFNTSGLSTARPVMRFRQVPAAAPIESVAASTRTWDVHSTNEVYFNSTTDNELIAGLRNADNDLGCVAATVAASGVGFTPASFSSINRSRKEISVTPTINGTITTYDVTMYMTTTEMNSVAPSTLQLLKTTSATDAGITSGNTTLVTPTIITGSGYVGFRGTFTGFGRYFLVDGPLCTPPPATITPAGPTTFCAGGDVVLNANTGTGLTYQWRLDGTDISGATSSSYTASVGGSYSVVVAQSACNATSSPVTVTVNSVSVAAITGSAPVCVLQTRTLANATTGGTWSSANTAIATITSGGVVTGVSGGVVTISYSYTNACGTATATTNVLVNSLPSVSAISGPGSVCAGSAITLTNATASGVWSSSSTGIATITSGGVVSGAAAGTATISYTVTNASGCVARATANVTVNTAPTATATAAGPTVVCFGGTVTLNAGTGAGYTYQWQNGGVNITGATSASYVATATGSYRVVVTNAGSCTATSSAIAVSISSAGSVVPAVSIVAVPGITICSASTSVTFTPTTVNGGTSPTYRWYVGATLVSAASSFTYVPAHGDVVRCVLTSNAPCAFPDTAVSVVSMSVIPTEHPLVRINPIPNDTLCESTLATFAAVTFFGGSAPSFVWNKNGTNVGAGPAYTYIPLNGDVIICTMTSNYGCRTTDTAISAPVVLDVEPNVPNVIIITASRTYLVSGEVDTFNAITSLPAATMSYQWYINGTAVAGATSARFITSSLVNGSIVKCRVTSTVFCASPANAESNGINIYVTNSINGIVHTLEGCSLVPNPNNGSFTIKGSLFRSDDMVNVRVTDVLGRVVFTNEYKATNGKFDEQITLSPDLASGIYHVAITATEGNVVFKVLIDK